LQTVAADLNSSAIVSICDASASLLCALARSRTLFALITIASASSTFALAPSIFCTSKFKLTNKSQLIHRVFDEFHLCAPASARIMRLLHDEQAKTKCAYALHLINIRKLQHAYSTSQESTHSTRSSEEAQKNARSKAAYRPLPQRCVWPSHFG
jgi:hypothetical protein